MVRAWTVVLGIGLVLMGLSGLGSLGGNWMSWVDFILAAASFAIAATEKASGTSLIAIALFVVWILGLNSGTATVSMSWWNFIFGCAYGLVTVAASRPQIPRERRRPLEDESRIDRTNRAA